MYICDNLSVYNDVGSEVERCGGEGVELYIRDEVGSGDGHILQFYLQVICMSGHFQMLIFPIRNTIKNQYVNF